MDPEEVTLYYFTCDKYTAKPSVILVSSDYEAVVKRRNSIAASAAAGEDVCTEPHAIMHKTVRFY